MLHIITLLLSTSFSLLSMELIQHEPSNSSSEVYFFTQQIYQNYCLPTEIKNKLLTKYISSTIDEYNSSDRYNQLIDACDYMHLSKNNKYHIQKLFSTEKSMEIHSINNNQRIVLGNFPNAQKNYQNILALPLKIRQKIADKYSAMIFVKTTEKDLDELETKDEEELELVIIILVEAVIGMLLDNYIKIHPMFTWVIPSIPLSCITKIIYDKYRLPTSDEAFKYYHYNGYTLLPLLPEDKK